MESWELGGTLDVVDIRLLLACLALVFSSIAMGSMMIEIEKDKDRGEQLSVGLALRLRLLCSFFWDSDCDDVMIGKDFKKKSRAPAGCRGNGGFAPITANRGSNREMWEKCPQISIGDSLGSFGQYIRYPNHVNNFVNESCKRIIILY